MRKMWVRFALGLVLASVWAGCAGDMGDVDRVQPGYVTKADLLGSSWYYRRTVVDAPETMEGYASIGTGDLFTIERIRWDIQEKHLIAYRDYEYVPGADGGELPGSDYQGTPIAAFPIDSHFDILWEYNAETGEKTNVRSENTTDRQWWERSYMRVNWSANDNPNLDFIIPIEFLQNGNPGDFFVHEDDATSPYRARIEPNRGYVDFVATHFVVPDPYLCYALYDFDVYDAINCGAGEIRVRHAFLKVNPEEAASYEALHFPDSVPLTRPDPVTGEPQEIFDPNTGEVVREPIFDRFGYYRIERLTYDSERGLTESGRLNRIIRFDIWDKSIDQNGNVIPYADRKPTPVVYYTNWDFPEELEGTATEVANEWNKVFKLALASMQQRPADDGICDQSQSGDPDCNIPDMFVLRRNSCNPANINNYFSGHKEVLKSAEAAMGVKWPGTEVEFHLLDNWCASAEYFSRDLADPFTWQQEGDPRYNMLNYIRKVTPAGWSGYGPMLGDPVTGQIVTATANIMGWTIEDAATRTTEYIDYMNGDLSLNDLLMGENAPQLLADGDYDPRAHTYDINQALAYGSEVMSEQHMDKLVSRVESLGPTYESRMVPLENGDYYADRLARIRGTDVEREYLVRPEDLMLASHGAWMPGMPVPEDLWEKASFLTRRPEVTARYEKSMRFLQERCFEPQASLDDVMVGLAKRLKDLSHDQRRTAILKAIFKAVAIHEIGHNVGLRHNFEASMDALNYPKRFWEIETSNLSYQEKLEANQPEFMYSSIMDYHGKVNADFQGLSHWDLAAVKFGYGQILEKFADPTVEGGATLRSWLKDHDYRELLLDSSVDGHQDNHPPYFNSIDQMYNRSDVVFDWRKVTDEITVRDLLEDEVPYFFCSDEYNNRTATCRQSDFGANQREVQAANKVSYRNYFLFTRYLRHRLVLDWDRALTRADMTFANTMRTYKHMYRDLSRNPQEYRNTDAFYDMATATAKGLDLMTEVIALPQPAVHHKCVLNDGDGDPNNDQVTYYTEGYITWDPLVDVTMGKGPNDDPDTGVVENCYMDLSTRIPLGEGYPLFFGFSEDYILWTFTYLGTYWDKSMVIDYMTYPPIQYLRENQIEDQRTYSVSLYRLYPEEVNDILLGLIEMDRVGLASRLDSNARKVLPRTMFEDPDADMSGFPRIVPSLVRNMQYYSILFGMAYLSSPYDSTLNFSDHARVALKGAPDDFPAFDDPSVDLVECVLPEAGRTYRAMRTASAESRIDIAYNFVSECAQRVIIRDNSRASWENAVSVLESMDPNDPAYVTQERVTEDLFERWERADEQLKTTEQLLRYMRRVHQLYEHGVGY